MTGGLRRQVIVSLQIKSIQWTPNNEMFAIIGQEKVLRARTNKIPIPDMLKIFVEFFKQKIRPYLPPFCVALIIS
jgi:hypothetical protein